MSTVVKVRMGFVAAPLITALLLIFWSFGRLTRLELWAGLVFTGCFLRVPPVGVATSPKKFA